LTNYVPLHVHSHFSLFDGIATPMEYIDRALELEMTAIALSDHGSLSGHREFYRAAKEKGIKPILGVEGYITKDRFDHTDKKEKNDPLDLNYNHIIILAKNQQGLENLNRLNEIAWTEGFYKKPRIDYEVLEKYKDGLVVTSGCLSGTVAKAVESGELAAAKKQIEWHRDVFGDDYYIEVMPHNPAEINHQLLALADEFGVKAVVTPDCHHAHTGQKDIQELKLILNTYSNKVQKEVTYEKSKKYETLKDRLKYLYGDRDISFDDFDIHLLSDEEMRNAMKSQGIDREDIYEHTREIADKVQEYDIQDGMDLLPVQYQNPDEELRLLAMSGLEKLGLADKEEYIERLNEELGVISSKSFGPYFLVVRNMINWAKKEGIMVGPGRGSSAGSLLCYSLGITDIDPIKHGLLFFRFINPERNDFPDIDSDIQDTRREEVKDYLVRQYRHVASIATFLQFKDKGVIRDIARVLYIPLTDVNKVSKLFDTWDEYCNSKSTAWFREKYPEVELYGDQLRGRIRGTGIHAAGVVTSKKPIFRFAPMETRQAPGSGERIPVVAVDMEEAERIGLIKIDALGLKTLSVLRNALDIINERHHKEIDLLSIDMEDSNVYEMLSSGYTKGVFQCMMPDQKIHTLDGVKKAEDVIAGDMVLTHKGRFRKVITPMRRYSSGEMYRIELGKQNSDPVFLTGEHPILVSDSSGNMDWVNVQDISGGRKSVSRSLTNWNSYAVVPKTSRDEDVFFIGQVVDKDFARFLGLYLAEGCFSKDGKMQLTFNKNEKEYSEFAAQCMKKYLGMNVSITNRDNCTIVRGNKKVLVEDFNENFGHLARNKKIPEFFYHAKRDIIESFLLGYSQGDGRILPSGQVGIQTASENLAWGLKALSANLGQFTEVKSHFRKVFGSEFQVFSVNLFLGKKRLNRVIDLKDYVLIPIRSVSRVEYSGDVVNFEVEEDNSYVSTFVMHNCEATPYTNLLVKMGVRNFAELAASNALVRPGAMNTIGKDYIARKHGKQGITFHHDVMKRFTAETFGCILYQEQVMQACVELGGMSMVEADKVRKIIGKKKDAKEFDVFKDRFVEGASRYLSPNIAKDLWQDFEAHAGYSFNKSHAVAYSTLSYWTAWLKYYYPLEFMFSILKNEKDKDARTEYLIETKRMGIPIRLPHVNDSDIDFKIEGKGIRFGLSSIKYISDGIASKYIEARPFTSYAQLEEFTLAKGTGVNTRALHSLNAIGAATFEDNPRNDEDIRSNLYEYLNLPEFNITIPSHYYAFINSVEDFEEKGSFVLMGMVKSIKRGKGWSRVEILDKTGSVGIFDEEQTAIETGKTYLILASDNRIVSIIPSEEIRSSEHALVKFLNYKQLPYGEKEMFVVSFKPRITKAGKKMATLTLADHSRDLHSVVVFPTTFAQAYMKIQEGNSYSFSLGKTKDGTVILEEINA
jgi:DNA polymerase III alpha subunit